MPRKVRFRNWKPDAVVDNVERDIERRLTAVGQVIQATAVRKLNRGQPVRRQPSGRLVGLAPSAPGEPPRTLTGRLKQSVAFEVARETGRFLLRVGTNVVYGRRLELGFHGRDRAGRNVAQDARPWLRPSVTESLPEIRKLLGAG